MKQIFSLNEIFLIASGFTDTHAHTHTFACWNYNEEMTDAKQEKHNFKRALQSYGDKFYI